jgi:hypothetical protein
MEKALEDLELHKGEAEFSIRKTAERYGLLDTTLQRGSRTSKESHYPTRRGACNLHSGLDY